MSDFERVQIEPQQFKALDQRLSAIQTTLAHIERTLYDGIEKLGKQSSIQNQSIIAGFAMVAEALRETNLPPQSDKLEVRFVFKVPNNHQDEPFSISIGGVTDAEGEALPDTKGLTVDVKSSDDGVVAVSFDPATNSGVASFGHSGVASLTASVTNAAGEILGSGAADFTVTTGDPAAVSDIKIAFSGISEEAPEGGEGDTGGVITGDE